MYPMRCSPLRNKRPSALVILMAMGEIDITDFLSFVGVFGTTCETPPQTSDRAVLVTLYNATDGPNWVNSENWLTDAPLGDWYGVDTDDSERVVCLRFAGRWNIDTRTNELPECDLVHMKTAY